MTFSLRSAGLLALFLFVSLPAASAPRAQGALEVYTCLRGGDNEIPLQGADVSARAGDGPVAEGTTGADGCVWLSIASTVGNEAAAPTGFHVGPVYPNPAGPSARVALNVDRAQPLTWRLYDLLGRLVRGPETVQLAPGSQQLDVDLRSVPQGRYALHLSADAHTSTQLLTKMASGPLAGGQAVPAAYSRSTTLLTFEASYPGYVSLVAEHQVEDGQTVTLALAQARGGTLPLSDMRPGETYVGLEGGLYAGSVNEAPPAHVAAGVEAAEAIEPLDAQGNPSPNGKLVLLSISMSNATQEFCHLFSSGAPGSPPCETWTFMGQAASDPAANHTSLVIANGAEGGEALQDWVDPNDPNYERVANTVLPGFGVTEAQVQVVWVKAALKAEPSRPTLPDPNADAYVLEATIGGVVRTLRLRYPNLRQVFFTSRIYGGYADPMSNSPEPWAYETGFSVKWAIEAQINQRATGQVDPQTGDLAGMPFMDWGPYLWADGEQPRADGLVWTEDYFEGDGMHPDPDGEEVVGSYLLDFFKASPLTRCWFLDDGGACGE